MRNYKKIPRSPNNPGQKKKCQKEYHYRSSDILQRHSKQSNKIKDPSLSTRNFSHFIFDKEPQTINWRKKITFKQIVLGETECPFVENKVRRVIISLHRN